MAKNITSIKRLLMGIILLLVVSLPTGCAKTHYKHYEGPPLPDSELALLKASKKIRSIDGHSHRYGTGGKDFAKALTTGLFSDDLGRTYWQILPGKHEIEIGVKDRGKTKTKSFLIEVEKGHTYEIKPKETLIKQEILAHKTVGDFWLRFFLVDVCCPSHAPVRLEHGIVKRIAATASTATATSDTGTTEKQASNKQIDAKWRRDPEAFAKLFFGNDLSVRSRRKKITGIEKPSVRKKVLGSYVEWPVNYGISPGWLIIDERGRKALSGIGGNIAIYAVFGPDETICSGWITLLSGSRQEQGQEIDWTDMTSGIPPQSDLLMKMKIKSVSPIILHNGILFILVDGSDLQFETSSKRCNWPRYKNELSISVSGPYSTDPEVLIISPHKFPIKVGLRTNDMGRDFIVPPEGSAGAIVPEGKYNIYFQYSEDPTSLYQGDSFEVKDHDVKIELKATVDGNYSIRRAK